MAKRAAKTKIVMTDSEVSDFLTAFNPSYNYVELKRKDIMQLPALAGAVLGWAKLIEKKLIKSAEDSKNTGTLQQSIQATNLKTNETNGAVSIDIVIDETYQYVNDGRTGRGKFSNKYKGDKKPFTRDKSRLVGTPKAQAKLPPFDPISKWIGSKASFKQKARNITKGIRLGQTARVGDKVKKMLIVDAVRWGIYNHGIAPTYFYTNVVNQSAFTALNKAAAKALGRDIQINIKFSLPQIK